MHKTSNERQATNQDVEKISKLIFNIWINEYGFKVSRHDYPDLTNIESYYINKAGNFLVAILNQKVVGTIASERLKDKVFILKRMFVSQDFRGKGTAQALLDALLQDYHLGDSFYLSTNQDLALAAKKFYLKNGFRPIDKTELPQGFPFFYEDDLFMRKII